MKEETLAVVNWWVAEIGLGAKRNIGLSNNQSDGLAAILMLMAASQQTTPTNENIEVFKKSLADYVEERLERNENLILSTDYTPDYMWNDILKECGISGSFFPMKTVMWVSNGKVDVSVGHASKSKTIYSV